MFKVGEYDRAGGACMPNGTCFGNFTFGLGGFQGARGENRGGDFFVENLAEELDTPGEYYFDRRSGKLYLFYNGTGPPPPELEVVATQLKVLVNASGERWQPLSGLSVEGITFRASAYTYMEPHGVPSGGDW